MWMRFKRQTLSSLFSPLVMRERERERERERYVMERRGWKKKKNEDRKNSGDTFVEDCALKMRLV